MPLFAAHVPSAPRHQAETRPLYVGIGRPYIWGLSAFGQAGVERVLDILRDELTLTMAQMGTPTIKDITPARVMHL
jgi:isopentenyl diphosphate isomerase/L-lactate dehydrogenase-like FMN-dependent dehydrogenase